MPQVNQNIIEQMNRDVDKKHADELVEINIKIMAAAYDKAIAYTNLIIVAGYASFFGLWQISKDNLSARETLWAALLMLVSASVFVFFEVTKMFAHSRQLHNLNKIVTDPNVVGSHTTLRQALDLHNKKLRSHSIYWGYWWYFTWIITVVSAISAVCVLAWGFASGLLHLVG